MPTTREYRAQRLMNKATLDDLKMPTYMSKRNEPPDKENDLYPLRWPGYKSADIQDKINDVLGPLSLFAPYPHEDEPEPEIVLERPVTPINEEIKSQPTTFEKLASYVRRRIAAQDGVPYLSIEDQQDLAAIIMGEVNHIWPDIRRQIDDPFLTAEENKELNRRIAVHIVTVCEKLFHHYLHKAQILNERGVFSGPANMSRLKAQLALDADKFLNILTMRRYLVADMRGKMKEEPVALRRLHSPVAPKQAHKPQVVKPLTFTSMIQSSRPKSDSQAQKLQSLEQELLDIAEAMPYLDTSKLVELVADLPERGIQTPSEENVGIQQGIFHSASCNSPSSSVFYEHPAPSRISEGNFSRMSGALIQNLPSRGNLGLQRANSQPVLHAGETLLEELGIETKVKRDDLLENELNILYQDRVSLAKAKDMVVTKPRLGEANFLSEDLRRLMMEKDDTGVDVSEVDDLPPLLQAITRHARHDNIKRRLEQQLKELEEKEKERHEQDIIGVHPPTHPQPATINANIGNKMVVRTSDIRVSERVCLSSITLNRYATVYNDLIEEIDAVTVKSMDKNLFLSDEICEVYSEIMKTVPSDHLNLDHDSMVVYAPESVNVAGTMVSSTLSKKVSQRVINPDLYHERPPPWGQQDMKTWARTPTNPPKNFQGEDVFAPITPNMEKIHEVMYNPSKMSQMMASVINLPSVVADKMSRTYASWLQWWKSTVTADDYMKYLSTLESDYMAVVFHFYDSEEEDSEEEDGGGTARGRISRRTMSSKQLQEQRPTGSRRKREKESKLAELRAVKNEYKAGVWNPNCVLMGGLGKDPVLQEDEVETSRLNKTVESRSHSAKTLQERAIIARQARNLTVPQDRHTMSRMSKTTAGFSETAGNSETLEEEGEGRKLKEPQERLENVWNSLQMPDSQRLDMAIKYSCGDFFAKLTEAVEGWEAATDLILKREGVLAKLEHFERKASDPNRFFAKENGVKKSSVLLLEEARYRTYIYKKIESLDAEIKVELEYLKEKFQDTVSLKGRPYEDKMKWDRTEMLHWLQEERRLNALRFESLMRHIPLKPAFLEPIIMGQAK